MYNEENFTSYLLNYKDCDELICLVAYFLNAGYGVSLPDDIEELRSYFYSIDVDFIIIKQLGEAYLSWKYMMFNNEHKKRIAEFNNEHRERIIEFNNKQFDLSETIRINMERIGYLKDKNRQVIENSKRKREYISGIAPMHKLNNPL